MVKAPGIGDDMPKKKFDPEGSGYDDDGAVSAGVKPDDTGHWQSRVPETGLILKGRKHPTWHLTEKGEAEAGHEIYKNEADQRYYSRPKKTKYQKYKDAMEATPE